jgi:putative addiction module component (TIGR02574 family)
MILMHEILEMSVAERILMIEKIWDSIDPSTVSLSDAHQQELDKRLKRYENGETSFVTWDSIKKELNTAR